MTYATFAPARPATAIPLHEWAPWAIFAGLVLLLAIYFVGAEQGATSLISGKMRTNCARRTASPRLSLPLTHMSQASWLGRFSSAGCLSASLRACSPSAS